MLLWCLFVTTVTHAMQMELTYLSTALGVLSMVLPVE